MWAGNRFTKNRVTPQYCVGDSRAGIYRYCATIPTNTPSEKVELENLSHTLRSKN
jgi:hypothetical protein